MTYIRLITYYSATVYRLPQAHSVGENTRYEFLKAHVCTIHTNSPIATGWAIYT